MPAGKTLNTGNALYGNIVRALSGDTILPKMVALDGGADTASQPWHYAISETVSGLTWIAIQGVVRTATNWFAIDTGEIRKYNLTNTLLTTNASPYTSLPAGVDHLGAGFVDGGLLYTPAVNWDGATNTATVQTIAIYNTSDLSLNSQIDISAQTDCNGSSVCLSEDGTEIYVTSFYGTVDALDDRNLDIYRFNKSTGAYIGIITMNDACVGIQSLVRHDGSWFMGSYDNAGSNNLIYRYDDSWNLLTKIDPIGSSAEMEGLTSYDGVLYFNHINGTPRTLDLTNMFLGFNASKGDPVQFLDNADIPESATLLVRANMYTLLDYRTFIDNQTDANNWEAWNETDQDFQWRVDSSQKVTETLLNPNQEYLFALTWEKVGANVTIKLGIDGTYRDTNSAGTWVTPPTGGLWLGGVNTANGQGDNLYNDILLFDKVLSDAELLDSYTNFDDFYVADAGGITVTESLVNTNYTTLDPTITLTGTISITESVVNTNYTSLNPTINLGGVISIIESLVNVNYDSLDPIIEFTGTVSIVENLVNTNYISLDPTVTLVSTAIQITESTVAVQYQSKDPSILLTPEPIGIVSTVCFNGELVDLVYNGQEVSLEYNGQSVSLVFSGQFNELEFNGTIQTTCNTGSISTDC